jgi:CMP-N-acetylneuraminic acid synthetase
MKANSQRIPGKNFKSFCGKPLFRWVLDALLSIDSIDRVVINTDARGILASHGIFESKRLIIRDRRSDLCGDTVSMNLILADDIQAVPAETYLMTHTTNPFISSETIIKALDTFKERRQTASSDSLFTVNKFQSRFYRADGSPINHDPANLIPTQDLEPWFEENSNLYIFTKDSFMATKARIGKIPYLFQTPRFESVDIDTPEDWDFALAVSNFFLGKFHNETNQ